MLEVKNISFEVAQNDGTAEIIKDLSFTIPDGRLTVITGPNGGGKSTLAKLIMGPGKISASFRSPSGLGWGSATPSSSRPGLRG